MAWKIVPVDEQNLPQAALVHAAGWQDSHRGICSPAFVAQHTPQRQEAFLREEMEKGKSLFLLVDDDRPAGIAGVSGHMVEHLYVHPACQGKGYGTALLSHVMALCDAPPTLWVMNVNEKARRFYVHRGFVMTGRPKKLSDSLSEWEMQYPEDMVVNADNEHHVK